MFSFPALVVSEVVPLDVYGTHWQAKLKTVVAVETTKAQVVLPRECRARRGTAANLPAILSGGSLERVAPNGSRSM